MGGKNLQGMWYNTMGIPIKGQWTIYQALQATVSGGIQN